MAKGVFIHNQISNYDDLPEAQYHFPKMYLKRAKPLVGDWVLYYESGKGQGRKSYTGVAKVASIIPDATQDGMYYALIEPRSYAPFENLVPFKTDGKIANSFLTKPDGTVNGGRAIAAVQSISDKDFLTIFEQGLPPHSEALPRMEESPEELELRERDSNVFEHEFEREIIEVRFNKKLRDRTFRKNVIEAYDRRCAFTGMRLINGGGRAEVQAAHIKPVAANGPDSVNNGLALSGTIHWMFDRGYLSVSDQYDILVSRHVNNTDEVDRLIVKDRKVLLPETRGYWPHPNYLQWHRDNCFKQ